MKVDDVVAQPIELVDGAAVLPDSVGTGVAVDEKKVARYRCRF